jgi:NAD(P)-dependent dehydrogenase (short-subunit alcohol dehydrogenase family)
VRILITGCSSGIGRALVLELVARGHQVIATARDSRALRDLPEAVERAVLDVTDEQSISAALDRAGALDGLVNNAAWSVMGPVEKVPLEVVRRMFEVNLFGAARMIQAVAPGMRARGSGVIVNVSSLAGRVVPPLGGFYSASKFALEALSEALHLELSHFGVRVAVVEPGYVDTPFRAKAGQFGTDDPPYNELQRQWSGSDDKLVGGARPGPEGVAVAIADAVEGRDDKLRWVVGKDSELVLGARRAMDDREFEAAMRKLLQLDW